MSEQLGDRPTTAACQAWIRRLYHAQDAARGATGTFVWLVEEVGELGAALRSEPLTSQAAEFADVYAWLLSLANVAGVDLEQAFAKKYGPGCPGCGKPVCACQSAKP